LPHLKEEPQWISTNGSWLRATWQRWSFHKAISGYSRFFDVLDRINALVEASPGFVWRLRSDSGNATDILPTS